MTARELVEWLRRLKSRASPKKRRWKTDKVKP
jgi:hypothetical protein